jgi:integrase
MTLTLERYSDTPTHQLKTLTDLPEGELRRLTLKALLERDLSFLNSLFASDLHLHARAGSKHTTRAYLKSVELFLHDSPFSVLQPARDDAQMYLRTLEERGLKPSSVKLRLAALRAFYSTLQWAGVIVENPFTLARALRDKQDAAHKRKPYRKDELERLIQVAEPLETLLLLLLAHAGLRISEALALEGRDVYFGENRLRVRHGKGDKERYVTLSVRLRKTLETRSEVGKFFEWNDQAARYRMRKLSARAEVDPLNRMFHSLRHYCGTELMRNTKNLTLVKEHLGHANVNTAALYAKVVDTELEGALEGL